MSLQVWLTGNNTMNNQGLLENLTQTTSPSYVDGKFGKSMSTGGYKMTASQTSQVLNNEAISICFWIYINAATGKNDGLVKLFGNDNMSSTTNNRKFTIFNYPTVNDLHISWMNNTANATFASTILSGVLPSYKWTHVAVTYQNPNGTIYINGEKVKTFSGVSESTSFAYDTQVIYNSSYLYWNDYRIYNNCLSPKEIKEISKGLLCHYKLSSGGGANLVKGNFSCTSTKDAYTSTGTVACTLTANDILNNKGKTLTLSYKVKSPGTSTSSAPGNWASGRFGIHGNFRYINSSGTSVQLYPLADLLSNGKTEGLYSCSWTIPTDINSIESSLGFSIQTSPSDGFAKPASDNTNTWYLKDVKLEWGNKATPWIPNSNDPEYPTLGYNDSTEYDFSGYNNDGTKVGTIVSSSDSIRYSGSYNVSGTNRINAQNIAFENISKGTMSFWIKFNGSFNNWSHYIFFANGFNWTGNGLDFIIVANSSNLASNANASSTSIAIDCCSYVAMFTAAVNTWYHIAITWDAENYTIKKYLNGALLESINDSTNKRLNSYRASHGSHCIGNESTVSQYNGNFNISDFRIYSTELSADDVKSLYNTPASISNTGDLMAYEFVEEV